MRRAAALAVALAVGLTGCTGEQERPPQSTPSTPRTPSAPPTTTTTSAPAEPAVWSIADARVDRVPAEPEPLAVPGLTRRFPADDAVLPDVRSDPPGRAIAAYHPRERFDRASGWGTERVFLLGIDGRWRTLDLADLGLPEAWWPGPDTYGAGDLSPDGRTWAGPTRAGQVFVDLATGKSRHLAIPGSQHHSYAAWRDDGRTLEAVHYLRRQAAQTTWTLDPRTGDVRRAEHRLRLLGATSPETTQTLVGQGVPRRHLRSGARVGSDRTLLRLRRSLLAVDGDTGRPVARMRAGTILQQWLDADRVLVAHGPTGLLSWNVGTGAVEAVTRVRPRTGDGRYWSVALAADLVSR